ncbi:uncharacterized protein LOC135341067 [Halichondria panicea]|uniref:uncharacterized protein LOC135341067 n=1 Tax=Halichondria panicea TaxID=6063 RepID=UPI00312B6294
MTTRSGRLYKMSSNEGTDLTSLREMMQLMLEDRRKRDEEIAQERQRREDELAAEREQREEQRRAESELREEQRRQREEELARDRQMWEEQFAEEHHQLKEQMALLQRLVIDKTARPPTGESRPSLKLSRLLDVDDIEAFLITFERSMGAYEVDKSRWTCLLAPQLTGKAQQAYVAMAADTANDYDQLKNAILRRYDINEETYRQRFRSQKMNTGESPKELVTRLTDLATRWTRTCTDIVQVIDLMVTEQFLEGLTEEVRLHVSERKPKTSGEAAQFVEDYIQAHHTTGNKSTEKTPPGNCPKCGLLGHWARDCPSPRQENTRLPPRREPTCFNCHEKGHFANKCPSNPNLFCDEGKATLMFQPTSNSNEKIIR